MSSRYSDAMSRHGLVVATLAMSVTVSCADPPRETAAAIFTGPPPSDATYLGHQVRRLDDDLAMFVVEMRGARGDLDVDAYARCVAARYALIRGYGFARHIRTNVAEKAGLWRANAVYTVSPALPEGLRTIDADVTVARCRADGIATI